MYFPYFRGKQFELITIRENAELISRSKIVPIIEPVKKSLSGLGRALEALRNNKARFILVVNPQDGELIGETSTLWEHIVDGVLSTYKNYSLGYIVHSGSNIDEVKIFCKNQKHHISIIHYGYSRGRELAEALSDVTSITDHIFIEQYCTRIYRRHFVNPSRVLIRDGFIARTNREHPAREHFSDLHITYEEEGVSGFGDFLIVGEDFTETGGPAYTVAIHLTFIDPNEDQDMFIKHYLSDRIYTPTDPGGKFLESLQKLVDDVNNQKSNIYQSEAVKEFKSLHRQEHFPGLGYVKKLSMQHHIELMADFIGA